MPLSNGQLRGLKSHPPTLHAAALLLLLAATTLAIYKPRGMTRYRQRRQQQQGRMLVRSLQRPIRPTEVTTWDTPSTQPSRTTQPGGVQPARNVGSMPPRALGYLVEA
jgi:hypothetical protein